MKQNNSHHIQISNMIARRLQSYAEAGDNAAQSLIDKMTVGAQKGVQLSYNFAYEVRWMGTAVEQSEVAILCYGVMLSTEAYITRENVTHSRAMATVLRGTVDDVKRTLMADSLKGSSTSHYSNAQEHHKRAAYSTFLSRFEPYLDELEEAMREELGDWQSHTV